LTAAIGRLTTRFTDQYPVPDLVGVRLPIAAVLAVPIFAPFFLPSSFYLSLAVTTAIYVMVVNGLHIIFSYTGQLSLGQTTLWGLGAYTAALLTNHYDWPTFALLPAAAIVAAAGAVAIGVPAFRTAGFSFAIITFGFAEIMRLVGNNWWSLTNGNTGLFIREPADPIGPITFDTIDDLPNFYFLVLAFAYLSIVAVFLIRQSSVGKTFIAIRENEQLARSVGINIYFHKLLAFAISGAFAGVAGVFLVYQNRHVQPDLFSAFVTIQFLLMILIGGRFSMLGPTIGAVVVVFGPEVVNALVGDVLNATRRQIIFGGVLAMSVLTAPNGIAGQTRQGYNTFFTVLRLSRQQGHAWPVCAARALGRAIVPAPLDVAATTTAPADRGPS
jgi:branched-chain amino acid transport system permease protein